MLFRSYLKKLVKVTYHLTCYCELTTTRNGKQLICLFFKRLFRFEYLKALCRKDFCSTNILFYVCFDNTVDQILPI